MKEIKSVQDFNEIIRQDKPVLLDFYADWCGPCQALLPTVEKLANQYSDKIEVAKVNIDQNNALAAKLNVRSIPALFFIQDRAVKEKLVGFQSEAALNSKFAAYSR
ncbi:thioredoxin [Aureispira anguillae]|uniref:Thioredoxin n=1 Tax=Aureispira anguillae TaxID=2864201 RepID=A0A916DQ63_9BACT|nr:thioredoxin [Aureispira anguillae]BDS09910.1 thioredoxin [Aureispira anguillae]